MAASGGTTERSTVKDNLTYSYHAIFYFGIALVALMGLVWILELFYFQVMGCPPASTKDGFGPEDYCPRLFPPDFGRYLRDYGEFITFGAAAAILLWDTFRDNDREFKAKKDKIKTARYWVLYNASSRINQDLGMLEQLEGVVGIKAKPDVSDMGAFNLKKLQEIEVTPTVQDAVTNNIQLIQDTVKSFTHTWQNDDVLSEAITLEFSLLSSPERQLALLYFDSYSTLEDQVYWLKPLLERKDGQDLVQPSPDGSHILRYLSDSDRRLVAQRLLVIIWMLHQTSQMGHDLMTLYMGLEPLEDFPAFHMRTQSHLERGADYDMIHTPYETDADAQKIMDKYVKNGHHTS